MVASQTDALRTGLALPVIGRSGTRGRWRVKSSASLGVRGDKSPDLSHQEARPGQAT